MNPGLPITFDAYGTIVFDLDGTLIDGIPYEETLEEISEITGVSFADLLRRYAANFTSIEEAQSYHLSLANDFDVRVEIARSYERFLAAKTHPLVQPGSRELLRTIRGIVPRITLVCWTRGVESLQRASLVASGLDVFFDRIICVGEKTPRTVRTRLLPKIDGAPFLMAGDMYAEDILPLLDVPSCDLVWVSGSRANAYVPRPDAVHDRVLEIPSIAHLLD